MTEHATPATHVTKEAPKEKSDVEQAQKKLDDAQAAYDKAMEEAVKKQKDVTDAKVALSKAQADASMEGAVK